MLSTISSVYGTLGIEAPFVFERWKILQRLKVGWDEEVPENLKEVCWENKLQKLENNKVSRCYKPDNFGKPDKFINFRSQVKKVMANVHISGSSTNSELSIVFFS